MKPPRPRVTPTDLIHHPYQPPAGFEAIAPGVFKASTVVFPNVAALRARRWQSKAGYTYGLHGTPTTFTLEERIASLEGGTDTLLAPSGLAALALVNMALLRAGDEVLLPDNAYGPNKDWVREELSRWGIAHRLYDPLDAQSLRSMITPATKLLWLEAAGSVTMEFPDLVGLTRVAREHGLIVALDNTWGAGLAFSPFAFGPNISAGSNAAARPEGEQAAASVLGVDISVHALTKYPSGGADLLMGSVTTVDRSLHLRLKATHMRLGLGVGANDVELVLRALPTLPLRYAAHDQAARTLAAWFTSRPEVSAVLHPALEGSPGHAYWKSLCGAAAGLFSVVFAQRYATAQVDAFVDALRLFKIGYSWGGPVSLVVPYDARSMRELPLPHAGTLVRFCVGLEDVADLQADCEQALRQALGAT